MNATETIADMKSHEAAMRYAMTGSHADALAFIRSVESGQSSGMFHLTDYTKAWLRNLTTAKFFAR